MPVYEYKCIMCKEISEHIFSMREAIGIVKCTCGGVATKIMSTGTFKINGYSEKNGYAKEKNV